MTIKKKQGTSPRTDDFFLGLGMFIIPNWGCYFLKGWLEFQGRDILQNEYGIERVGKSWKMISLSKWMIFRFHVNFSGENEVSKC